MEGLTYSKNGDYLIPDLVMDGEDGTGEMPLGKYGMLRQSYLKEHRKGTYAALLLSGELAKHLRETDRMAQERVDREVKEMMERKGIDERLKADDQMAWVQAVNMLTMQAEEAAFQEIVYS